MLSGTCHEGTIDTYGVVLAVCTRKADSRRVDAAAATDLEGKEHEDLREAVECERLYIRAPGSKTCRIEHRRHRLQREELCEDCQHTCPCGSPEILTDDLRADEVVARSDVAWDLEGEVTAVILPMASVRFPSATHA